jgi:hypothetical protein
MAVTNLSQAINDAWVKFGRTGTVTNGTARQGLVSDLAVNDFLLGPRAQVIAAPAAVGGVRTLTLRRRGTLDFTVNWPDTAIVWFVR